jgi:hypothetical protein
MPQLLEVLESYTITLVESLWFVWGFVTYMPRHTGHVQPEHVVDLRASGARWENIGEFPTRIG